MKLIIRGLLLLVIVFSLGHKVNTLELENNQLNIGEKAPEFELMGFKENDSQINRLWRLNDFHDSWLVLYFYPKDFTKGCTIEARGFKNISEKVKPYNVQIVGISNDSIDQHKSFCGKENLNILLLTDKAGVTSKAYDSWNSPYSERNTFVIDPKGNIVYKWQNVNPTSHPKDVLKVLNEIIEN